MNIFDAELLAGTGIRDLVCLGTRVPIDVSKCDLKVGSETSPVRMGVRPHDVFWASEAPSRCTAGFEADIELVELTGAEAFAVARPVGTDLTIEIRVPRSLVDAAGTKIKVAFDPRDVHLFDPILGNRVITWGSRESRQQHDGEAGHPTQTGLAGPSVSAVL
jgi:ABC-type sugar transport system ATPase subunit